MITDEDSMSETAVWPTFILFNIITALKRTLFYCLLTCSMNVNGELRNFDPTFLMQWPKHDGDLNSIRFL